MNTVSSVVTFLMVFLIQNTQNRDSAALQVKIDELIRATSSRQDLIGIEEMSGPELDSKRREVRMEDDRNRMLIADGMKVFELPRLGKGQNPSTAG